MYVHHARNRIVADRYNRKLTNIIIIIVTFMVDLDLDLWNPGLCYWTIRVACYRRW